MTTATSTGATRRVGPGRYLIDGQPVPSVTTVLDTLNKPALPRWAAREVAAYAVDHVDAWGLLDRDAAMELLKGAPYRQSSRAAARGTDIHRHAEALIHGAADEVPPELEPYVEACARWMDRWAISPGLVECPVFHRTLGYAGEPDLFALSNRHEEPVLVDYKTGRGVYPEAALQLAAYRYAEFRLDTEGTPRLLPEVAGTYVIHLGPGTWEAVPVTADEDRFEVFVHLLAVHRAHLGAEAWLEHAITEELEP